MSNLESQLIGTWDLKRFELLNLTSNQSIYPYGTSPKGILIFSAEKYMTVALMANDRKAFATESLQFASVEEKTKAIETYLSYAGLWRIEDDKIFVDVKVSLLPNWTDATHYRTLQLEGDTLSFQTPIIKQGTQEIRVELQWERVTN